MFKSVTHQNVTLPEDMSHITINTDNIMVLMSELHQLKHYLGVVDKDIDVSFLFYCIFKAFWNLFTRN